MLAQGISQRTIGKQLGLQRNTVRRYARAATAEELLTIPRNRDTDPRWSSLPP
jgi:DNA-binding transcriptional regulator LsrR (DeoR family)